ncbi:hypothetical protein MUP29_14250, partial [bacterium]|nr:hypothetical protein [bacterium]
IKNQKGLKAHNTTCKDSTINNVRSEILSSKPLTSVFLMLNFLKGVQMAAKSINGGEKCLN